jgi:hypothetical protein
MAFRIKENCLAVVIAAASLAAQPLTFTARKHTLTADETGVTIDARHWTYSDIQRLTLAPERLTLLTYSDRKWQPGRERQYVIDHLPDGAAAQLYPLLRAHMDQRFIVELPDPGAPALWQMPAKMELGWKGANGTLIAGTDRIVFETGQRNASRTWRYADIANISHSGLFDFSLSTQLGRQVRFSLKEPLAEERFHALWLRLEEVNGLAPYESKLGHKEH